MWDQKFKICVEDAEKLKDNKNARFLQRVAEENRLMKDMDNGLIERNRENPHILEVRSSTALCSELKNNLQQEFIKEKRRQQLRQNSHVLRELEEKLRAAYVRKTIDAQIFEKKAIQNLKEFEAHNCEEVLTKAQRNHFGEEKRAKKEAFRKDLLEQIAMTKARKLKAYESMMRDKEQMDEAVRKCREDAEQKKREVVEKKMETKAEIEELQRSREKYRAEQNLASQEEHEKMEELIRQRHMEEERSKQEKREKQLRKEQLSLEMGRQVHAISVEKAKARDTLTELLVDERLFNENNRYRKELEQKERDRISICKQFQHDIKEKERREKQEQEEDEKFYQEQMRILAERDKLDQLSDEKRRRKQIEHRRALLEGLNEKNRYKAMHMKRDILKLERAQRNAEKQQQEIEDERIRMIKEHAPALVGYLPKGII